MKFTDVPRPAVAGVVRERTPAEAICAVKNCELKGATVLDLHLSTLDRSFRRAEALRPIIACTRLPILALNYAANYDYSPIPDMTEDERIDSLREAALAGAAAVDLQGYTLDPASKTTFRGDRSLPFVKDGIRELVTDPEIIARQTALIREFQAGGCQVLLSNHPGVVMKAEEVLALAKFLEPRGADVIKIVTASVTEEDAVEAMRAMLLLKKELSCPVSYHANGKAGRLTRVVNPMLGGFMAFCVDGYAVNNLPEQLDLATASEIFEKLKRLM